MRRRPTRARLWTALAALLIALAIVTGLAACVQEPEIAAEEASAYAGATVEPMGAGQKREDLAEGFPIEVPVAAGDVFESGAETIAGTLTWSYALEVAAPMETVEDWYVVAYDTAHWDLVSGADGPDGGSEMAFEKGGARTELIVRPGESGAAVVEAKVRIGDAGTET